MNERDTLTKMAGQLEMLISGISGLADILEIHSEMLEVIGKRQVNLKGWLEEPPKSDLPDLVKQWVAEMVGMRIEIGEMRTEIGDLTSRVHAL